MFRWERPLLLRTGVYARFRLQPVVGPAFMPGAGESRAQPSSHCFAMSTPFTGFLCSVTVRLMGHSWREEAGKPGIFWALLIFLRFGGPTASCRIALSGVLCKSNKIWRRSKPLLLQKLRNRQISCVSAGCVPPYLIRLYAPFVLGWAFGRSRRRGRA